MYFSRTFGIAVFLLLHLVGRHDATEKIKLDKGVTLAKCCPIGEIFQLDSLGRETCSKSETSWKIQINGTSYNSTDLIEKKILVYDSRSKVREHIVHK